MLCFVGVGELGGLFGGGVAFCHKMLMIRCMTDADGQPVSVALVSLGCPKNLVDSEKMLARLAEGRCVVGAPMDDADVIVINTCGFLADARDEAMGVIREALEYKASGRASRVVVAGCMAQRNGDELFEQAPGIDAIVGVNDRDSILAAVLGESKSQVSSPSGSIGSDAGRFRLTPRHVAYLRIAEGCSHNCRFCTIPAIRGPFRSKAADAVLAEAGELIADGAVELNVIAQDTTSYGTDHGDVDLAGLLRRLDAMEGATWIRLMYTYPRRFTDDLVAAIRDCENVVPYVDIPLQHISESVLGRMGRKVSRRRVEELLDSLRDAGVAIRTTFIVGFPGETEAEFAELLDFACDFGFDAVGAFQYSHEPDTPAARLKGRVDDALIQERHERLMLAQQEIAFAAAREKIGTEFEIVIDESNAETPPLARHAGQAPDVDSVCVLESGSASPGEFMRVRCVGADDYDLIVRPM